ncbi:MAG: DMT family transporter [Bacteroidales bacterium]|nr:DMT family transporter [Bacteroidales bacterium]
MLMIIGKGDGTKVSLQGILYLVFAVVTAVIYSVILVKMVNKYRPYTLTLYTNLFGLVYFLPLFFCGHFSTLMHLRVTAGMWGALLCLGIGCSVLAYILFNFGVRAVGAARASVFNNIIPLFTLFFAVMIGQEGITWQKLAGMVVTVAGVCIAQKKPGKLPAPYHMRDSNPRSSE